jgi:hypothetical protein
VVDLRACSSSHHPLTPSSAEEGSHFHGSLQLFSLTNCGDASLPPVGGHVIPAKAGSHAQCFSDRGLFPLKCRSAVLC